MSDQELVLAAMEQVKAATAATVAPDVKGGGAASKSNTTVRLGDAMACLGNAGNGCF